MTTTPTTDRLTLALAESAAMRSITEILAGLPDDASRARVLGWCKEHFQSAAAPVPPPRDNDLPKPPASRFADDPALAVDDDIFEDLPARGDLVHCDDLRCGDLEFEDVELDGLEIDLGPPPARSPRQAPGGVGLDSLLRDFVCDLQRLALECQMA